MAAHPSPGARHAPTARTRCRLHPPVATQVRAAEGGPGAGEAGTGAGEISRPAQAGFGVRATQAGFGVQATQAGHRHATHRLRMPFRHRH
jgi:hypothetical protein